MVDIKPSTVLEDSKGSRYFFYYKDSSIYYREIPSTGDTKDTILISQANEDFAAAIDADDTIYLVCNSRYKGVLLFIYSNSGWKFESVVNPHSSSSIYVMDIIVQNGSIHIFFSKKLPVANMYNVYHIHKNINDRIAYMDYTWRKNSLSEIYSQNIENSYSILPAKSGIIHYASVWYDGAHYFINYYCYDDSTKSWIHKSLSVSYKNQVSVKLIQHNKKINLLCFFNVNEASNIYHFLSKSSGNSEIAFKEHNNARIDTKGVIPLFYTDDKAIQMAWIKDKVFHQYTFDDSSGKWRKAIDLPVTAETNIYIFKVIRNPNTLSITKAYYILDKNFKILRPVEYLPQNIIEDNSKEKSQASASPEMNDCLKQILLEMKDLSDNIRYLNNRIDSLESKTFVQKSYKEDAKYSPPAKPITSVRNDVEPPDLKKSSFKEKFMKSRKTPNFESLLIKQENINTYIGKPGDTSSGNIFQGIKASTDIAGNEKQAFVPPGAVVKKNTNNKNNEREEIQYTYNSLFKKIGEFFK